MTWSALVGVALLSTALAYILYFRILGSAGATNVTLVVLLVPVSAVLLAWLLFAEPIGLIAIAGIAVLAAGLSIVISPVRKRRLFAASFARPPGPS